MLKKLINQILSRSGYAIITKDNWRPKHNFEKLEISPGIKKSILENTMLNESRLVNIVVTTDYVVKNNIPGDFVECGVWKGGSVALMAYSLKKLNEIRDIHLFDCFDDICQPDVEVDGEKAVWEAGGTHFAKGNLSPVKGIYDNQGGCGNEIKVKSLLVENVGYASNHVIIHKGWFQDTLPNDESIIKIALLRLDGDWYASTKVCLENLYHKVASGGVIIVDDYGCYEGCKKAVDEFLEKENISPFQIKVDDECIYWIKN